MEKQYFRITGYNPKDNVCFIIDSNGKFEKLWQFSAYLVQKGIKVIEVGNEEKFLDGNVPKAPANSENLILRATADGEPEHITKTVNGISYKAVKVGDKFYIPDKTQVV